MGLEKLPETESEGPTFALSDDIDSSLIGDDHGDDYLVVASVGGMPTHPAWYLNPRYDVDQSRTDRVIPVVILTPTS